MSHLEVTQRILSAEARVDSTGSATVGCPRPTGPRSATPSGPGRAPLFIDDNPNPTVMEIRAKARRLKSRSGDLGLMVVDYLQLMTGRHAPRTARSRCPRSAVASRSWPASWRCPSWPSSQLPASSRPRADKPPDARRPPRVRRLTARHPSCPADTGVPVSLGDLLDRASATSRCGPSTTSPDRSRPHVARVPERREGGVPAAAGVGSGGRAEREPSVPRGRAAGMARDLAR